MTGAGKALRLHAETHGIVMLDSCRAGQLERSSSLSTFSSFAQGNKDAPPSSHARLAVPVPGIPSQKAWVFHARCCPAAHVERLLSWLIHGCNSFILYHHFRSLSRPTLDAGRLDSPAWLPATAALTSIIERGNTRGVTCLSGVHLRCLHLQQGLDSYLRNIQ